MLLILHKRSIQPKYVRNRKLPTRVPLKGEVIRVQYIINRIDTKCAILVYRYIGYKSIHPFIPGLLSIVEYLPLAFLAPRGIELPVLKQGVFGLIFYYQISMFITELRLKNIQLIDSGLVTSNQKAKAFAMT